MRSERVSRSRPAAGPSSGSARAAASYASAHDPRLLIGLGKVDVVPTVTVRWPSGCVSHLKDLATNRTYEVVEPTPKSEQPHGSNGPEPAAGTEVLDPERRWNGAEIVPDRAWARRGAARKPFHAEHGNKGLPGPSARSRSQEVILDPFLGARTRTFEHVAGAN